MMKKINLSQALKTEFKINCKYIKKKIKNNQT